MKRLKLLPALIVFIVLLSGCGTQSVSTSAPALPSDDGATEITVEVSLDTGGFYKNAALKFEKETGIKVNVIMGAQVQEEYLADVERMQAELMAGKGADIYANTHIDFIESGQNGHLCNLADWIAADSSFSDDAFYMNILTSGFDEGNVYSVPLFMMFDALGSTIEVPELDGQSVNWEEFFDLTKGIKRSGVLCGMSDYEIFIWRFRDIYDRLINEDNMTQNLDTPEMTELLEQCRKWGADGLCAPHDAKNYMQLFSNAFFTESLGGIDMLLNIRVDNPYIEGEYFWYDIPSDSGKNDKTNKIMATDYICINAASQSKGTVWMFVKFLLSEEMQSTSFLTPVNRKAAAKHMSTNLNEIVGYFTLDIDPDQALKEAQTILNTVARVRSTNRNEIEQIVFKEVKRYFLNEISADAAAKSMAAAVDLYFKEQ